MNQEFESYIMRCARQHELKNPQEKVHLYKTVEIPKDECEYCSKNKAIYDTPFSFEAYVNKGKLIIGDGESLVGTKINYCPMCGRKI